VKSERSVQPAFIFEDSLMTSENNYIGKQLGNYRIMEELASGSFGRAIQLHPNFAAAHNGKSWTLWQLGR